MFKLAKASCRLVGWLPPPIQGWLHRRNIHRERWVRIGPMVVTEVTILGFYIADLPGPE